MERKSWLDFIGGRLKSQIALETGERLQTWAFALIGLLGLGYSFGLSAQIRDAGRLFETKVLFLILSHVFIFFAFYLPALLEKGENAAARFLGVRHFSALVFNAAALTFLAGVTCMLSFQLFNTGGEVQMSGFFTTVAAANAVLFAFYASAGVIFFLALSFFPQFLIKVFEKTAKAFYVFFGLHLAFAVLLGIAYAGQVALGSDLFFEELRAAGIYAISLGCLLLLVGSVLRESFVPALAALEFELVSGRLDRHEDILNRYKETFLSSRLSGWLHRQSHYVAARSHEIAGYAHDAVQSISQDKPSEVDLRRVEDRYRKTDQVYHRLEKSSNRFLLAVSFLNLSEAEREKVESLRDQFSRELRNAKIELASVRKRIDEKLVAIKNSQTPKMVTGPQPTIEKISLNT